MAARRTAAERIARKGKSQSIATGAAFRTGETEPLLKADPAYLARSEVARTPGMDDLIWAIDCAISHAAQVYRDAHPGAFDWQSLEDRAKAIRLVALAGMASALETDKFN